MWDCDQCGCRAIAASVTRCPQCGKEREMPKVTVDNGPSNRWEDDTAQPPAGDATPAAAATADPGAGDGDGNGSEAVSEPQKTVKPKTRKPASGDGDGDGPEAA